MNRYNHPGNPGYQFVRNLTPIVSDSVPTSDHRASFQCRADYGLDEVPQETGTGPGPGPQDSAQNPQQQKQYIPGLMNINSSM